MQINQQSCQLRPVAVDDARLLFEWRNRPAIRQAMFTTGEIDWSRHLAWIRYTVASKTSNAFIFEQADRPVGYVKLDWESVNSMNWGFYIGAEGAPVGSGSRMLFLALDEAFGVLGANYVGASVRSDNSASLSIHKKLGFKRLFEDKHAATVSFKTTCYHWSHKRIILAETLFLPYQEYGG